LINIHVIKKFDYVDFVFEGYSQRFLAMRCGGIKGMKLSTQKKDNVEKQASTVNKTAIAAGPGLGEDY
jgi:hypothetical protein